jgi:hypothetical protein
MHGYLKGSLPTIKPLIGTSLAHRLPYKAEPERADVALDLIERRVCLTGLTVRQAAAITGVPLAKLNELRRRQAGCSLRQAQRRRRADRAVAEFGAELMQALDRATRPQQVVGE